MSYHLRPIKVMGELGKASKLHEELDEFEEALEQDNKILAVCELADMFGALEALAATFKVSMFDLQKMSDATKRAFQSGERK